MHIECVSGVQPYSEIKKFNQYFITICINKNPLKISIFWVEYAKFIELQKYLDFKIFSTFLLFNTFEK